jgi:hypothetical protein
MTTPTFALWHLRRAPPDAAALRETLFPGGVGVERVRSYRDWTRSDADVLVLRATDGTGLPTDDAFVRRLDLRALEGRRVLGIGSEAGRVFGAMGLEIGAGRAAGFASARPTVELERREGSGRVRSRVVACRGPARATGRRRWECEALFVPRDADDAGPIDVVARCASDPAYAAVAREMNYVFCGVSADVRRWTAEFRAAFRGLALDLAAAAPRPFARHEWPLTAPGDFDVRWSPTAPQRTFFFRFAEPVLFSAQLRVTGSESVEMLLAPDFGSDGMRACGGDDGETLHLVHPVLAREIRENRGRYWRLEVARFGGTAARARLRVDVVPGAVLDFGPDLRVPLEDPPRDAATVRKLVALLRDPDAARVARAAAALVAIGPPARRAVEAELARAGETPPFLRYLEGVRDPTDVDPSQVVDFVVRAMKDPRTRALATLLARIGS